MFWIEATNAANGKCLVNLEHVQAIHDAGDHINLWLNIQDAPFSSNAYDFEGVCELLSRHHMLKA